MMRNRRLKYHYISPSILEIIWPAEINKAILMDILQLKEALNSQWPNELLDMVMGYHCLSLHFRSEVNFPEVLTEIEELRTSALFSGFSARKRWHIPVCYDLKYGNDLASVASFHKLEVEEVVHEHSSTIYLLYFYGFMPGFMYLGGLSENLHTPRKSVPDRKVEKGSVAIGGKQTGIYPMDSPGGWWVIGRSPVNIFNLKSKKIVSAQPGDEIKFEAVDPVLFQDILKQEAAGGYTLKHEMVDG